MGASKPGTDRGFVCENTVLCAFDAFATAEGIVCDFRYIDFESISRGSVNLLGGPDSWNISCGDVGLYGASVNQTGRTADLLFVFLFRNFRAQLEFPFPDD